jgi:putative Ca2+/H+ antiporter (TMEM165/GDT1 family)
MLAFVAGSLLLVALLVAARRNRAEFAIGVAIGLALAGVAAAAAPAFHLQRIPPWLPALPFACVAVTLFFFGALAWWWGSDR